MKRKLKVKNIIILATVMVLVITSILYFLLRGKGSPYKEYNEEDKAVGAIQNYEKDTDDFYISIFYPSFNIKTLDNKIKDILESDIKEQKPSNNKNTLYMDYSVKENLDQYIVTRLNFQRFDDEDVVITNKEKVITYDKKKDQILTIRDVFRGTYKEFLKTKGIDNIDDSSTDISLDKNNIYLYTNQNDLNKKITIPYKECQTYLALNNRTINPNAPEKVITPTPLPKVDPNKPMIAITFDDGPHVTNTQRAMSLLEQYNGRGTFFMLGNLVNTYPDIVKEMYERGFQLANHSWSHPNLKKKDLQVANDEIFNTQNAIFSITGYDPNWFRPPYGSYNDSIKQLSNSGGVNIMLWTGDTLDWKYRDEESVKQAILRDAHDGAVILLHDIHKTSIDGLELALPILKEQGYQFVTMDTLKQYRDVKDW